ncbi:MAG: hypothetical protein A2381_12270 [Bdellovibrionales bacterium RIFOXYB1_FULL_37_110]|nr:MAG: hypothetical protein A2181_01990 [Bdellovibrionales bacterium RIFOXYA1_FULL_38_20]OFZ52271.1 MAG: hypothetical protein A2417_06110 [Bdellovibrionales bacterium RIFOXYC1_FULL_37_79]OFZ57258.1 MAG: hypothetical protein A2381_12270 [Bdellovibrionales bacterium RIFOXYB1_FULL_37_110]OFZ65260.1 MAG: hypothetical protein A2577_04705 [Bdellovibrionales bacterium RIFOXYD1_FULL_36_51]
MDRSIAEMIKKMRKERGITQKQLAEYAGVSFSTINRLEKGERNITWGTVKNILEVFGYSLSVIKKPSKDSYSTNEEIEA